MMLRFIGSCFFIFMVTGSGWAQPGKLDVTVKTVDGEFVNTVISESAFSPNATVYSVLLNNRNNKDQLLQSIDVTITPSALIPEGTTYITGADEMFRKQGGTVRTVTGAPTRNNDNNMYLMFKFSDKEYWLLGVISWRTFLCQIYEEKGKVKVVGDGDNRLLKKGEKLSFEKIVFLRGNNWQDLLEQYGDLIVRENKVAPPPRKTFKGWATWDFYVQHFIPSDIDRNMPLMRELADINIIQIDGGWWKQRGDYFEYRDNIPGGPKAIIDKIHKAGFQAGLHFDGFRVSKSAKIVAAHPEYFVHDKEGHLVESGTDPVAKTPLVYWDYSHPGAQAYITEVMQQARENWGVDYFKIDFMRNGLVTKGKSYLPVTNVERYRMGIEAMRKGIKNAYFLACSPNFGVNIGLVEASRTGPDIDPDYNAVKIRVTHNSGSFYFNNKIYNCDPDYLVVRDRSESNERDGKKPSLTNKQAAMWAGFVSIFGNVRLESDELSLLSKDKKSLVTNCMNMPFFEKAVPIDFWDHYTHSADAPNFFLCKSRDGQICIALFNWEKEKAVFEVSGFQLPGTASQYNGSLKQTINNGKIRLPLAGISAVLLKYEGKESFDQLCKSLSLKKS